MTHREHRRVMLAGISQKIIIEEQDEKAPLMVMFHGGPWLPMVYGMAYAGFYPRLSRRFTLVWWDQYGCGANHDRHVPTTICIEDFAAMAIDLVDALHRRYPDRAIILNGFSFGTYLTMQVVKSRPDIVSAVINVSPIMDMRQAVGNFRQIVDTRLSPADHRRLDFLRESGAYGSYLDRVESLAKKYSHTCGIPGFNGMSLRWLMRWLVSDEYHCGDVIGALMGSLPPGRSRRFAMLWDSMGDVDLWSIARSMTVPVLYIQGDGERYVLPDQLRRLAEQHDSIWYVRIAHSGHMPTHRAWNHIEQAMIDFGVDMTSHQG